ncbi:MAG: hypothetical protein QMD50_01125 [Patescibacteria group bacterium]|nr:hypothetical protein [Patescibacteria group bacterium]
MKKIIFSVIILFVGISFFLQFTPIVNAETQLKNATISQEEAAVLQASLNVLKNMLLELQNKANSVPQATIVKSENADIAILKQGLDTLSVILTEMQARLRESQELKIDKTALNTNLDSIAKNLVALSSNLKNVNLKSIITIINKPTQIITKNKPPAPEENIIATKEQRDEILSAQLINDSEKLSLATIIGIISILILGIATFLFFKEKPENKKIEAAYQKKELTPQMQNSSAIHPAQPPRPPQHTRIPQGIRTPQQPQTESYFIKTEDKRKPA